MAFFTQQGRPLPPLRIEDRDREIEEVARFDFEEVPFPPAPGTAQPCKRPGCDRDKARPMCQCGRDRCATSVGAGNLCSLCIRDEAARAEERGRRSRKHQTLDMCETVEELKEWIRKHLLEEDR